MKTFNKFINLLKTAYIWTSLTIHNAWGIINVFLRVIARGEKGNMFFVDPRKLSRGYKFDPSKKLSNIADRLIEKFSYAGKI